MMVVAMVLFLVEQGLVKSLVVLLAEIYGLEAI